MLCLMTRRDRVAGSRVDRAGSVGVNECGCAEENVEWQEVACTLATDTVTQ